MIPGSLLRHRLPAKHALVSGVFSAGSLVFKQRLEACLDLCLGHWAAKTIIQRNKAPQWGMLTLQISIRLSPCFGRRSEELQNMALNPQVAHDGKLVFNPVSFWGQLRGTKWRQKFWGTHILRGTQVRLLSYSSARIFPEEMTILGFLVP